MPSGSKSCRGLRELGMALHNKSLGKGALLALALHDWMFDGWSWMTTVHDSLSHGWAGMIDDFGFVSWLTILAVIAGVVWFSRSDAGLRLSSRADDLMPDR
jgi:hypothetical protein